jgi:5-methyltetrahydropteroyltriglutamate--homocysteine methyltransferase
VWETLKLPEGLKVIPGVIDSTTNMGRILGRENIIAGVDCGFGVSGVAKPKVDPNVAWAKLRALVEGAKIADDEL